VFAAGFESYNPATGKNLPVRELPNVVTSIELKGSSAAPRNPGQMDQAQRWQRAPQIAWLQCVAPRTQGQCGLCSSICACLRSRKHSSLGEEQRCRNTRSFTWTCEPLERISSVTDSAEKDKGGVCEEPDPQH